MCVWNDPQSQVDNASGRVDVHDRNGWRGTRLINPPPPGSAEAKEGRMLECPARTHWLPTGDFLCPRCVGVFLSGESIGGGDGKLVRKVQQSLVLGVSFLSLWKMRGVTAGRTLCFVVKAAKSMSCAACALQLNLLIVLISRNPHASVLFSVTVMEDDHDPACPCVHTS
eukprot:scaffold28308_cov19-Tisochrysis_lutea.AAC.3